MFKVIKKRIMGLEGRGNKELVMDRVERREMIIHMGGHSYYRYMMGLIIH
jgi:hypothetical protein